MLLTPLPRGMRDVCLFRVPQFIVVQSSPGDHGDTGLALVGKYALKVGKSFGGKRREGQR